MKNFRNIKKRPGFYFMIILGAITLITTLFISPFHANALSRHQVKRMVIKESMNSIVPPSLALAVAKVESDFNPNALSSAGARGIMQIMPKTGRLEFGVTADELWNPRLNIQLGIDFLAQLYREYGNRWDLALSHYNGGTLRGHGRNARPHGYTRSYVKNVNRWKKRYEEQATVWQVAYNADSKGNTHIYDFDRTEVKAALRESLDDYRKLSKTKTSNRYRLKEKSTPRSYWRTDGSEDKFDEAFWERVKRTRARLDLFRTMPDNQKS